MAHPHTTAGPTRLEDALVVLFCLVDDAYLLLNPRGRRYASLKKLSDSEVLTLALLQQLRGVESERSFLRDAARFFSHLFPGVVGLHPSSFHRRLRKLGRFLEPLRRFVVGDLVGDPETMLVDSTLLPVLHPRQVKQSAVGFHGASWARWGSFAVYGVKLHLLCSTNRVPLSYELTPANAADVLLVGELLDEARLGDGVARRLFGDLAYRSAKLKEALGERGVLLAAERSERRPSLRQQVEVCFASLKRAFGLGATLAKTPVGLATRIAAKLCSYTYGLYVNRLLGRLQGRVKELWA
ncbi:MAG: transposase [Actinomycetota bacterium]|nr:transposase [Actinomycetota bacterium]MDP9487076.1 transposase [Actinomycetota bacterium]